ncbi:MAG: glycosyltransferase [bacterium]
MHVGVITEGISEHEIAAQPWIYHRETLARDGVRIDVFPADGDGFEQGFDAMLLHVWQDWRNPRRFNAQRILPVMQRYAVYRARFPDTVQIILNHVDMARPPYATAYWRPGDPVLYKTPPYDRSELTPFPVETIWAYEKVWGAPVYVSAEPLLYQAGFVGTASGPRGYRQRVAAATATVGIGQCTAERPYLRVEHDALMARCRIIVCPRGWGEHSGRHWDAWMSGKPVLTDRACAGVEMIPGQELRAGEHFLVFDEPEEIPDLVSDWCRPSRADELAAIAERGRQAALAYDGLECMRQFFARIAPR